MGLGAQPLGVMPQGSWRDRWLGFRDRLLQHRGFHRWAASMPLVRGIARRRARELFDLCAGFVYSQVLYACVKLKLIPMLAETPLTPQEAAERMAIPASSAERLLRAAASLRLVEARSGGRFGLGDLGAALLANPGVVAMIEHHCVLYADLADPVAMLRGESKGKTGLAAYWAYAGSAEPDGLAAGSVGCYSALMSESQHLVCELLLDAYPLSSHRRLMDVGGGDGTFLGHVASRVRDLDLVLFDLPAVAERAAMRFAASGLTGRASVIGGSFLSGPLPSGADVISLVRVLHDHDDKAVRILLRAVYDALPEGGVLLVLEPMAGTAGAEPVGDAYFGFYFLAMGSGRARSAGELRSMLTQAGFRSVRQVPTRWPMQAGLLVARRGRTR